MEPNKGVQYETDDLTGDKLIADHDYDGIQELDNDLPKWWLWLFYITIIFSVIYVLRYHVMDWGPEALLYTLEQYRQNDWSYYGGGENLAEATQPIRIEHNGNKLAFLGCNKAGPRYAWATLDSPGAAPCDMEGFFEEVQDLRTEGYLPIFTFQWQEKSYTQPDQIIAFKKTIEAGAVIVNGSQAHQPQMFEFYGEGFIHYGLGNLFFDQMQSLEHRQEFLDRHVFYDGQHISTELLTAMLENYAQPRPMKVEERALLLERIFTASGLRAPEN